MKNRANWPEDVENSIKTIIQNWYDTEESPDANRKNIDFQNFLEEHKQNNFNDTLSILEKYHNLTAINVKRNFDWSILSKHEEDVIAKIMTDEYKSGICDPSRPVAVIERSQSLFRKNKNQKLQEMVASGKPKKK